MMLGEVMTAARKSGRGIEDWLSVAEPEIWKALGEAADAEGMDNAAYAQMSVADFSNKAPEEDWATMMSRIRDAQDPGQACLLSMITWRLAAKAEKSCSCGNTH